MTFHSPGFVNTTRIYEVLPGANRYQDVIMHRRDSYIEFDTDAGGAIPVSDTLGGNITIPAGALVDSQGDPLTGTVLASATFLDVTDEQQLLAAPGDFSARMLDESMAVLSSFGIAEIDIQDGLSGNAFRL